MEKYFVDPLCKCTFSHRLSTVIAMIIYCFNEIIYNVNLIIVLIMNDLSSCPVVAHVPVSLSGETIQTLNEMKSQSWVMIIHHGCGILR